MSRNRPTTYPLIVPGRRGAPDVIITRTRGYPGPRWLVDGSYHRDSLRDAYACARSIARLPCVHVQEEVDEDGRIWQSRTDGQRPAARPGLHWRTRDLMRRIDGWPHAE